MAIAYYIPDQAKLAQQKPKIIKNIKIPLNENTLYDNLCWELIAQIFCSVLRYHYLAAGNGNLQISIEFMYQNQNQPPQNTSAAEVFPKKMDRTDDCNN